MNVDIIHATCPACRKRWKVFPGRRYKHQGRTYTPEPTSRGRCTCPECHFTPVKGRPRYSAEKNADPAQRKRAGEITREAWQEYTVDRMIEGDR